MEWKSEYRIGLYDIDEEHKTIIDCVSHIEQAMAKRDQQAANAAVARLVHLVRVHFMLEENLMRIHGYPRIEEHADHHKHFLAGLNALEKRLLSTDAFQDGIECLREWWITHMQEHDKSIAFHILKRSHTHASR